MEVKQAVIMVGGKGTRLYPLTENTPKPALPVLDMPCLKYLIRSFASAGITDVFLACGYKSDVLREAIGDGSDLGVSIVYSDEDTPLGTGGAMKQLESRLDPMFAAANGDTFIDIDLREQIELHLSTEAKITIALTTVDNPCEYGIARIMDDGRITEFKDKPKPEEVFSNYINAGIYVVDRSVLAHIPERTFFDFSKDLVPIITKLGERVQGYKLTGGVWKDVGRPSDLIGTNLLMADRLYHDREFPVGEGTRITRPFYLGEGSSADGSVLESTVILKGSSVKDSTIAQSLIMEGCTVTQATVTNSILGRNCTVNRGATVRDCVLRDGTVVGEGEVLENRMG